MGQKSSALSPNKIEEVRRYRSTLFSNRELAEKARSRAPPSDIDKSDSYLKNKKDRVVKRNDSVSNLMKRKTVKFNFPDLESQPDSQQTWIQTKMQNANLSNYQNLEDVKLDDQVQDINYFDAVVGGGAGQDVNVYTATNQVELGAEDFYDRGGLNTLEADQGEDEFVSDVMYIMGKENRVVKENGSVEQFY